MDYKNAETNKPLSPKPKVNQLPHQWEIFNTENSMCMSNNFLTITDSKSKVPKFEPYFKLLNGV